MTRPFGRGLVGLGLLLAAVWMLLPLYGDSGGLSLWQVTSRFDLLMFGFVLAGLGLVGASFVLGATGQIDGLLPIVAGGTASVIVFAGLEYQWATPLRVLLAAVIAIALVAGSVLVTLPAPTAERLSASMGRAGQQAAARRAAAAQSRQRQATTPVSRPSATPAGWYPDPSGQFGTRFWDGGAWTEQVR
jgi:hypothetical protein